MSGNPREHMKKKGFWGGTPGQGSTQQSAGRDSGFPGARRISKFGIRIDLEEPAKPPSDGKTPSRPK
jgi:hypothetical protein